MQVSAHSSVLVHFSELVDPRVDRTKLHPLLSVVGIALCGVICGADSWVEVAEFGGSRREWLAEWLDLPAGIPSHDTFGWVFADLDPVGFETCFAGWVRAVAPATGGQMVALDEKVSRGSHDRRAGRTALDLGSAWARASMYSTSRSSTISALAARRRIASSNTWITCTSTSRTRW